MAQQAAGIVFPPGPDGTPSSRLAGTRFLAAALGALDSEHGQDALREARWRHAYPLHLRRLVEGAMRPPEAALASAQAGLAAAWEPLAFARPDGASATLREALNDGDAAALHTVRLQGRGDARPARWQVPLQAAVRAAAARTTLA